MEGRHRRESVGGRAIERAGIACRGTRDNGTVDEGAAGSRASRIGAPGADAKGGPTSYHSRSRSTSMDLAVAKEGGRVEVKGKREEREWQRNGSWRHSDRRHGTAPAVGREDLATALGHGERACGVRRGAPRHDQNEMA